MTIRYRPWPVVLTAALTCLAAGSPYHSLAATPTNASRPVQQAFASPDAASASLVAAVRSGDAGRIERVLGPGSDRLVRSGDAIADRQARERFVAAYEKQSKIELQGDARATLFIGENEWPLPFPLIKHADGWTFDTKAGAEEILNRRIGRNERAAIQVCLAYVDAQREYASSVEGNHNGLHEYAMKFGSAAGRKDGLYWPTRDGEPSSPLGPLVAKAQEEGYGRGKNAANEPYHGYFYRILTAQGSDAPGGAYDYVVRRRMIGGFALVAFPARWGASGVMTFIVNHDGVVYQKNLGRSTTAVASRMTRFNPDPTWSKATQ